MELKIDFSNLSESVISENEQYWAFIDWGSMDKMKLFRIILKNDSVLYKVNLLLNNKGYLPYEVFILLQKDFDRFYKIFNFNIKQLDTYNIYILLCLGKIELYDEFEKNNILENHNFSFLQAFDIVRAYDYEEKVIHKLDLMDNLKPYQIVEIIVIKGEESLIYLDTNCLSAFNWLDILSNRPELFRYAPLDKFLKGDLYNLVRLIILFEKPNLLYLLDKVDNSKISPIGWEKLIIAKGDCIAPLVPFERLRENNWVEILKEHPYMDIYKIIK